jgi:hypothetical protein
LLVNERGWGPWFPVAPVTAIRRGIALMVVMLVKVRSCGDVEWGSTGILAEATGNFTKEFVRSRDICKTDISYDGKKKIPTATPLLDLVELPLMAMTGVYIVSSIAGTSRPHGESWRPETSARQFQ